MKGLSIENEAYWRRFEEPAGFLSQNDRDNEFRVSVFKGSSNSMG